MLQGVATSEDGRRKGAAINAERRRGIPAALAESGHYPCRDCGAHPAMRGYHGICPPCVRRYEHARQ